MFGLITNEKYFIVNLIIFLNNRLELICRKIKNKRDKIEGKVVGQLRRYGLISFIKLGLDKGTKSIIRRVKVMNH